MHFIGCKGTTVNAAKIVSFSYNSSSGQPALELVDTNNRTHLFQGTEEDLMKIISFQWGEL